MSDEPATPDCPSCQQRERRIAELERQLAAQQRELERVRQQLDQLRGQLDQSQQQSKRQAAPFRRRQHVENPKKPGRPPGHARAARPLPTQVDRVIDVPCDNCPDCQARLIDPVVHPQFQTDLPPVVPLVTRFDIHGGTCPCCHRSTTADTPTCSPMLWEPPPTRSGRWR